jgi:cellulose biosynthesis protein BcsQ
MKPALHVFSENASFIPVTPFPSSVNGSLEIIDKIKEISKKRAFYIDKIITKSKANNQKHTQNIDKYKKQMKPRHKHNIH